MTKHTEFKTVDDNALSAWIGQLHTRNGERSLHNYLIINHRWSSEEMPDISRQDLSHKNLSNADLKGVKAEEAMFVGTNLSGATLTNVKFTRAVLVNAILDNTDISDTKFNFAVLQNASFKAAKAENTIFSNANCYEANFSEAQLGKASFSNADTVQTLYVQANCCETDFSGTHVNTNTHAFSNTNLIAAKGISPFELKGDVTPAIYEPKDLLVAIKNKQISVDRSRNFTTSVETWNKNTEHKKHVKKVTEAIDHCWQEIGKRSSETETNRAMTQLHTQESEKIKGSFIPEKNAVELSTRTPKKTKKETNEAETPREKVKKSNKSKARDTDDDATKPTPKTKKSQRNLTEEPLTATPKKSDKKDYKENSSTRKEPPATEKKKKKRDSDTTPDKKKRSKHERTKSMPVVPITVDSDGTVTKHPAAKPESLSNSVIQELLQQSNAAAVLTQSQGTNTSSSHSAETPVSTNTHTSSATPPKNNTPTGTTEQYTNLPPAGKTPPQTTPRSDSSANNTPLKQSPAGATPPSSSGGNTPRTGSFASGDNHTDGTSNSSPSGANSFTERFTKMGGKSIFSPNNTTTPNVDPDLAAKLKARQAKSEVNTTETVKNDTPTQPQTYVEKYASNRSSSHGSHQEQVNAQRQLTRNSTGGRGQHNS